jgi:nickel-type superoxide dismutase maturation protease
MKPPFLDLRSIMAVLQRSRRRRGTGNADAKEARLAAASARAQGRLLDTLRLAQGRMLDTLGLSRRLFDTLRLARRLLLDGLGLARGRLLPLLPVFRVVVEGGSMEPTLYAGERLLIRGKLLGGASRIVRGDIAVVPDPREPSRLLVKRVGSVVADRLYLVGDNPEASTDSRVFGAVERDAILGRVISRYWPPERAGRL